tara:strand:+ start:188 stop:385 length:198 start_codon:yes stop_codon:yes gene_type:complete
MIHYGNGNIFVKKVKCGKLKNHDNHSVDERVITCKECLKLYLKTTTASEFISRRYKNRLKELDLL